MRVKGKRILVLGGAGLVGTAVCRELLTRGPAEIIIHSRRPENADAARKGLLLEAGDTRLAVASGDIFALLGAPSISEHLRAQLASLKDVSIERFLLYDLLVESAPDIVIDCVNTATAIAYRDVFDPAIRVLRQVCEGALSSADVETLLDSLYIPRLTRHMQVLYQSMIRAGTQVYIKVGTTGTGGMGLNIPYTHSEERPSRLLLSKSAVAGAHSMLLFLMARTPDAPITKEVKPAAAIGWKRIAHGAIERHGEPIRRVDSRPRPLGSTISSLDPSAATQLDESLEAAYIDTGENGLYSLEEFAAITAVQQMEFVTPEEIAQHVLFEIEGNNTGHDVIGALDAAVMGPSYRAGLMRHRALQRMKELEREHGTFSVAFEMLGPPRLSKLLFEAHLLRLALATMDAVRSSSPKSIADRLDALVRTNPAIANDVIAVGIPILLDSGEVLRGPHILVPADVHDEPVTAERLETWVHDGWVDLRQSNCAKWIERCQRIHHENERTPETDTSSRYLRGRGLWQEPNEIQPGEIAAWILERENHGERMKR
jgi:hypothetical protein